MAAFLVQPIARLALQPTWKLAARMVREVMPEARRVLIMGGADAGCEAGDLAAALQARGFICTSPGFPPPDAESAAVDLTACALALHNRSKEQRRQLLAELRGVGGYALLLDWRRPERNLDLPAACLERVLFRLVADTQARRNRLDYERRGGLEGVLYALHGHGITMDRRACLGGSMGLALVRWKS